MNHDHLCPSLHKDVIDGQICTFCELIRTVREEYDDACYPVSPI